MRPRRLDAVDVAVRGSRSSFATVSIHAGPKGRDAPTPAFDLSGPLLEKALAACVGGASSPAPGSGARATGASPQRKRQRRWQAAPRPGTFAADLVEEVPRGRLGKLATVNEEGKPSIVPSTPRRDGAGVNGDGAPLPPIPATPCVLRRPFIHVTTRLTTTNFKAY